MTILSGFTQSHITEREVAHQSPCGYDDAAWEDCTPDSVLEWWRAIGHPAIPATHAEAEALRCASGRPPTGGTNLADMRKAIQVRYDGATPTPIVGFTGIWGALTPGTAAAVQGSMGAFPDGSTWRRWDPAFAGSHCVCVFRPDATDRVWWCDPLAPEGTYQGEWMSKADFAAYVGSFAGSALIGTVVPDPGVDMYPIVAATVLAAPNPRSWSIPTGVTLGVYDPTQPGKQVDSIPGPTSAHADAEVTITWQAIPAGSTAPIPRGGPFLRISDGPWAGKLIVKAFVTLAPAAPIPTAADLLAAEQAGYDLAVNGAVVDVVQPQVHFPARPS